MLNRLSTWNALMHSGNPTNSVPVNNIIKAVKMNEVRRQGKSSQVRRPLLESQEFSNTRMYVLHSFVVSVACSVCLSIAHGWPNSQLCVINRNKTNCKYSISFHSGGQLCWTENATKEDTTHCIYVAILLRSPWLGLSPWVRMYGARSISR
jgi:hypothetical protein